MMKQIFTLMTAIILLCSTGCAAAQSRSGKKIGFGLPDGLKEYKKITATDLYLNLVSKPQLVAGGSGELVFALRNAGAKRVNIPEWLRNEPENVKLFVQPFLPGMKSPDPENWIEVVDPVQQPVIHSPLILMPDNQVMVSKKLEFVSKMRVAPGMERRFFLKAQINLKSLDTESETVVLRIISNIKEKGEKQEK